MHVETAVPRHFCSVLYHTGVSCVIMLTKQELIFTLKMWYQSGFPAIVAQSHDHFDSVPPTCKTMYNLHQQLEKHGTVFDFQRRGRNKTARSEENEALICQAAIQSSRKSTCTLPPKQGVSRQSVKRISYEAKCVHYIPRLTYGLLENDLGSRLLFWEHMLNEMDEDHYWFHKII
jgi:hypothetical protein